MIGPDRLSAFSAAARVPEQVAAYVNAVAGSRPERVETCIGYRTRDRLLLVGYPRHDPLDQAAMTAAVDAALKLPGVAHLTVIGPYRPSQAPAGIEARQDGYFELPVPAPQPGAKLRSLLRRAGRELGLEIGRSFASEHAALVRHYLETRALAPGTRLIFERIEPYVEASAGARIVSARRPDGRLAAFGVGEYCAFETAFFLFCFRDPAQAPPGSADLVLSGLMAEAGRRGQVRMNLGLGVDPGIGFFKRKWGARIVLPYVEVGWETAVKKTSGKGWRGFFGRRGS